MEPWCLSVLLLALMVGGAVSQNFNIPPTFSVSTYNFQLQEQVPLNTEVGMVMAEDDPGDTLSYFLLPETDFSAGLFMIEANTGVIRTAATIDREAILQELLSFRAYVRDQDNAISSVQVRVIILDINDNAPSFTNLDFNRNISENLGINNQIYRVTATDRDQGLNSDILYNLTEVPSRGDPFFNINPSLGVVELVRSLDYDTPQGRQHVLLITATDRADNPMTTDGVLTIYVEDINDQPPLFERSRYQYDIFENATKGTPLLSVSARDQDEGIQDSVYYSITAGNSEIQGIPSFTINPSSGLISVNATELDRETEDSYSLIVQATESNSNFFATTRVDITVFDVNDHFPVFELPRYDYNLDENRPRGTILGSVSATDNDDGLLAEFVFSLIDVNPSSSGDPLPFRIETVSLMGEAVAGEANIVTNRPLDYEDVNDRYFRFMVVATERDGGGTRNGTAEVEVNLRNLNDHGPIFQQTSYSATLPETTVQGSPVAMIVATDDDADSFGDLEYSIISGNIDDVFNITTLADSTALITTNGPLDYEQVNAFTLQVQVMDLAGAESRMNTTTVLVNVDNINDNPPIFVDAQGTQIHEVVVRVDEEQPRQSVYQIYVADSDGSLNELDVRIVAGNMLGYFEIDDGTLQVNTTRPLNFDLSTPNMDRFPLAIVVNDTRFFSTLMLTVNLIDINDNSPVFTNNSYSFSLAENTAQGVTVGSVLAIDDDSGTFGRVQYSLAGPSQYTDLFLITSNGDIQVVQSINRETMPGPLQFMVVASDLDMNVDERNMDVANITIYVLDINDNAPMFGQTSYSFSIPENTDQIIGVGVAATDVDLGENREITYEIIDGNMDYTFIIDPETGVLSRNATRTLDYEEERSYLLTITAEDEGETPLSSTTSVAIDISDENDNDPIFRETTYFTSIREDVGSGVSIIRVMADDRDDGLLGQLVYSILSVEGPASFDRVNGSFVLRENTQGIIDTVGSFDRENFEGPYTINVLVQDGGTPPNNGSTIVIVSVEDANDNRPELTIDTRNTSPEEEADTGIIVAKISATDRDETNTSNSEINYAITSVVPVLAPGVTNTPDVSGQFVLDYVAGSICVVTNASLDYEEITQYSITVRASDNGSPSLFSSGSFTVRVMDVNDNTPVFIFPAGATQYSATLDENSPFTRPITFIATDADAGTNAIIDFTGQDLPAGFTVGATGLTITANTLDYERDQSYTFNVTATDRGSPPRSAVAQVTVIVVDLNDNSPTFDSPSYTTDIDEGDYSLSAPVIQVVNSTDPDDGSFGEVTYEVFPQNSLFNITTLPDGSGEVRVRGMLDRETTSEQTITILVRDGGQPPLTATATVLILINDVNDNTPMFPQAVYSATIPENQSPGRALPDISVTASDRDLGTNQDLIFTLENTTDFWIAEDGGDIFTRKSFNFENPDEKFLEAIIVVRDNATNYLMSASALQVRITDANDNTPYFVNFINRTVTLLENTTVDTEVIDIDAMDEDSSSNGQLVYQLANDEGKFSIDGNGVISLVSALDRETTDSYNLTVSVMDMGQTPLSVTNYIYIMVEDVNDVPPVIDADSFNFLIPEDMNINSSLGSILAYDMDLDRNGEIEFEIVSGDSRFSIVTVPVASSDDRQTFAGRLYSSEEFDYESETLYILTVRASNVAVPYGSDEAEVIITVRDINDNAPVFSIPAGYVFNVPEITSPGSAVGTVAATDIDGGTRNGTVRYRFTGPAQPNFSIGMTSGVITLLLALDFETINRYDLTVEAYDLSVAPLSSNTTIIINVQDTNELAPVFSQSSYTGSLRENIVPPGVIEQVVATENEGGASSVTYSLSGNPGPFAINNVSGIITTTTTLDREQQSNYVLTVEATDNAPSPLSSFVQVFVQVIDTNDNAPTFGINTTRVRIPESSQVGTTLPETFTATDLDIGSNGNISYSIQPATAFNVHQATGVIFVVNPSLLDRESQPSLTLRLIATDGATERLPSTLFITVDLEDINDNPPVFVGAPYTTSIAEGAAEDVTVITLEVMDDDLNSNFDYSITGGDDVPNKFSIDPATGVIQTTAVTLDREDDEMYVLTVAVSDGGNPARTSTATVTVTVDDVNDNTPMCMGSFAVTVREANPLEAYLGTIQASDADSRMEDNPIGSGRLVYTLVDANLQSILRVDAGNGDVYARAEMLDFETLPSIPFSVRVSDQPAPPGRSLSAVCMGTITLVDINDNAPVFERNPYDLLVSESQAIGSTIVRVNANDGDDGTNGRVLYRFRGQSNMFLIDATSGEITLTGSLDSDVATRHVLDVEAVDQGLPSRNGQTAVIIRVRDVDDTAPIFQQSFYDTSVSEGASLDSSVTQLIANDPDSTQLNYGIYNGNINDVFRIDSTGTILLSKSLDREAQAFYTLDVVAVDSAGNNGTTSVRITLLDINDEAPMFNQMSYTAYINENSIEGTPVLPTTGNSTVAIQATDRDEPNTINSRITYSLEGAEASRFNIDGTSGDVTVARGANLNYETATDRTGISLTVIARDRGTNPQSSSVSFTIFVADVNDEAPVFTRLSGYAISVREDFTVNNLITDEVRASDVDTVGAGVRYSLTNAVPFASLDQFRIDRQTGDIFLESTLDRETTPTITLTVTASDMGEPPLNSEVRVLITVQDVNDNAPRFGQDIFIHEVPEFLGVGASAFEVTATDSDAPGPNSEVTYSINSTTAFFTISDSGVLTTLQPLDYETQQSHRLTVESCDNGSPRMCSSTIVLFNIQDFNDEAPVFDQSEYRTDVCLSNAVSGRLLIRPVATDADSGLNALLSYSISQGPQLFEIQSMSGLISMDVDAMATDVRSHELTVVATDSGAVSLSASATVIIRIVDCSTTSIYFTNPYLELTILEATNIFSTGRVDISVPLNGNPSVINFAPDVPVNPFSNLLNNIRIKDSVDLLPALRQNNGLNREARSLYTVVLQAQAANGNTTYTTVTLEVLDINDSPPVFVSDLYIFTVPENTTLTAPIGSVQAIDEDTASTNVVRYSIFGVMPSFLNAPFIIDPTTGVISMNMPLDRETTNMISFQVEATDSTFSATTNVRVTIEDINDCDPMFLESSYAFSFLENIPTGTSVGSVRATDCDDGANARLQYSISSGSVSIFALDSTAGVITTLNAIDFEQTSQYMLTITATDMGSPPRSGDVRVSFQVEDFNDCPPVFNNHPLSVSLPENSGGNLTLETFSVQDCDSGVNGVNGTRFSIIRGNEQGPLFSVDESSGVLRVLESLDREMQDTYIVGVRATDSSPTNPLFSVTEITVNVLDENDNSPMFQVSGGLTFMVSEGEDIGQNLFTADATDRDDGSNSEISYYLEEGNGDFSIEPSTGILSVARSLDREMQDLYELTVVATDLSSEPRSSNITVVITIQDENDNDPTILNIVSRVTRVTIQEGVHNGTEVFIVNATDPDIGANSFLTYFLDDNSNNLPFTVTSNVINANGELDYEEQTMYFLTVVAEDSGSPSRRTLATLIVEVTDANDNPPIFNQNAYVASQLENTRVGSSIVNVQATDRDQLNTSNSIIEYTLDYRNSDDAQYFIIDSVTGDIANNITLDRESRSSYSFVAVATNYLSTTRRSGTTMVTITVEDDNDEVPMFDSNLYTRVLMENTPPGTIIFTVSATDRDQANSPNSMLRFSLPPLSFNPFSVSPSGEVILINELNYEDTTSYNFEILVSDAGSPTLSSTARVAVNVTDVNDETPMFERSSYTVPVSEGVSPSSITPLLLTTLQYNDADTLLDNTRSTVTILEVTSNTNPQASIPSDLFTAATVSDMQRGELYLIRPVDYEEIQSYTVRVRIMNNANGVPGACSSQTTGDCRLSSTADVTVNVGDINDNDPVFTQSQYFGQISTTARPGSSVITVRATDADLSPQFRTIQYELQSNPQNRFRMDVNTGTLFTVGSFGDQDGSTFSLMVIALDASSSGANEARATITLDVLNDFKRIAITFNTNVDIITAKEAEIVTLLYNLTNYEIVIEPYRDFSADSGIATFIFHAVENGQIVDFSQFIERLGSNRDILFRRLSTCRITELTSIAVLEEFTYPPLLDTETIVILVMCFILIVGSIFLLGVAIRQRYVALHNARHKLLADVFYGSNVASSIVDNMEQENIELEMIETAGQKKQNPMFVHPYDNWAGVDTSAAESVEGESNLQRDNPLYESQEIRMEMFADDSDEDAGDDDERDEAELLAAALQDDEDDDDAEDNSVTAI